MVTSGVINFVLFIYKAVQRYTNMKIYPGEKHVCKLVFLYKFKNLKITCILDSLI